MMIKIRPLLFFVDIITSDFMCFVRVVRLFGALRWFWSCISVIFFSPIRSKMAA